LRDRVVPAAAIRAQQDQSADNVTKQKKPAVPVRTSSKTRSRSGNPAVRAGEVGQSARRKLEPARSRGQSKPSKKAPAAPPLLMESGALPPDGATYPQILRGESYVWWLSLLGVVVGLALFWLIGAVVSQALITLFWATTAGNQPYRDYFAKALAFELPLGMVAVNLGLAALIPVAWGLMAVIHQMKPRWLSSVQPRMRWRYFFGSLAIALVVLNGVMLLSTIVKPLSINPQSGFWAFLVVIVLTSPLQAAAEEIFFRGYLLQALGSLVSQAWFGVVVSSVIFAVLHGTQNLPLFADRLIFGLLAGLLVWRTGGLEAAIAAHVINNVFAYLYAGLTTSVATIRAVKGLGWVNAAFDVGGFAIFAVLAYLLSRLMTLRTRVSLSNVESRASGSPASSGLGLKRGLQ
jgi:membrane protease YdiL (CAAX protease family)